MVRASVNVWNNIECISYWQMCFSLTTTSTQHWQIQTSQTPVFFGWYLCLKLDQMRLQLKTLQICLLRNSRRKKPLTKTFMLYCFKNCNQSLKNIWTLWKSLGAHTYNSSWRSRLLQFYLCDFVSKTSNLWCEKKMIDMIQSRTRILDTMAKTR